MIEIEDTINKNLEVVLKDISTKEEIGIWVTKLYNYPASGEEIKFNGCLYEVLGCVTTANKSECLVRKIKDV